MKSIMRDSFIIVGLGNVGSQYAGSRHNIGFDIVDNLARRRNWEFVPGKGDFYQASANSLIKSRAQSKSSLFSLLRKMFGGRDLVEPDGFDESEALGGMLLKPTTLMNRSGLAANRVLELFDVVPQQLIIVVDDFHLPLGRLRFRKNGSHGGHNGLKSLIGELGTEDFPRLRVGIGPKPPNREIISFVLGQFDDSEASLKQAVVSRAADACEAILSEHFLLNPSKNPLDIIGTKYNTDVSNPASGSIGD